METAAVLTSRHFSMFWRNICLHLQGGRGQASQSHILERGNFHSRCLGGISNRHNFPIFTLFCALRSVGLRKLHWKLDNNIWHVLRDRMLFTKQAMLPVSDCCGLAEQLLRSYGACLSGLVILLKPRTKRPSIPVFPEVPNPSNRRQSKKLTHVKTWIPQRPCFKRKEKWMSFGSEEFIYRVH